MRGGYDQHIADPGRRVRWAYRTGPLAARTFGEAQLDLDSSSDETSATSFGSAMLKSRSSDAFTSQLKDFIRPVRHQHHELRQGDHPQADRSRMRSEDDAVRLHEVLRHRPGVGNTFSLHGRRVKDFVDNVLFGTGYTVDETCIPANWAFVNLDCSASIRE